MRATATTRQRRTVVGLSLLLLLLWLGTSSSVLRCCLVAAKTTNNDDDVYHYPPPEKEGTDDGVPEVVVTVVGGQPLPPEPFANEPQQQQQQQRDESSDDVGNRSTPPPKQQPPPQLLLEEPHVLPPPPPKQQEYAWKEDVPVVRGVYVLDSLRHFQTTVQRQQQQQQHDSATTTTTISGSSNSVPIFWLALLEDEACPYTQTLRTVLEGAAALLQQPQHQPQPQQQPYPPIFVGRVNVAQSQKDILVTTLGIAATPALVLVSAPTDTQQHDSYLVEYTGRTTTAADVVQGAVHYFDTISLTTQPQPVQYNNNKEPTTTTTAQQQQQPQHPLLAIRPRQFASAQDLHDFLHQHARRLATGRRHYRPVLRSAASAAEHYHVDWLFAATTSTDTNTEDGASKVDDDNVLVLVQCRQQQQQPHDEQQKQQYNNDYDDFDTMARTLSGRRDRLFFVVQDGCDVDGSVEAWEMDQDGKDASSSKQRPYVFRYSSPPPPSTNTAEEEGKVSRLVEFLVKVCTDTVLWFDRQTVAPIAFPNYRPVHAVLVVDMHDTVSAAAAAAVEKSTDQHSGNGDSTTTATTHVRSLLDDHALSVTMKRAVQQFRRACRRHRVLYASNILERDMVCLVVPSTETRILTTFGIDIWSHADQEVMAAASTDPDDDADFETNPTPTTNPTLPALFITDQRFGGTRRYYKDDDVDTETAMDEFIAAFWKGELPHEVKSSRRSARTNEAGVRILTADAIADELFTCNDTDQARHSLILFTAPTCGHCKRILVIWNRLARLLKHVGWDSFLKIYQIDVSENDIAATALNVSVHWLPDVYYMSPDHNNLIRYNVTDELGDGIGAVKQASQILEWLVYDVGGAFLGKDRIEQLLADLQKETAVLPG